MFTVKDVAERLRISVSTVYGLLDSGILGHYRCPGIRVSQAQLEQYLESTKREPVVVKRAGPRPRLKHLKL